MDFSLDTHNQEEEDNRRRGWLISISLHLLLLLIFLIPFFGELKEPKELQGVFVVFGNEDEESQIKFAQKYSDENSQAKEASETKPQKSNKPIKETPQKKAVVEEKKEEVKPSKSQADIKSDLVRNEDQISAAKEKRQEKKREEELEKQRIKEIEKAERLKEQKEEAARVENERLAEERKKALEAEKAKKEKAEQQLKNQKKQFGELFDQRKGPNAGDGDRGNPIGKSDEGAVDGLNGGTGKIGGGLSGRGLLYEPTIEDDSQIQGKVVIRVCVNKKGEVYEAKFTQKGSTTTDRRLVQLAEEAALKYLFTESKSDKQCGTITVDFKLR